MTGRDRLRAALQEGLDEVHDVASTDSADYATLGSSRAELGLEEVPVPARNPYEAALVLLFSRRFRLNDIGVNDSFFVLGGDSLQAAALMTQIERDFGVVLPVSAILDAQTPRQLGNLISGARDGSYPDGSLISIRPEGKGPPVFCVHAYLGDVGYGHALASTLRPPRPVYGLRAIGLQDGEIPVLSVKTIASRYVAEIRTIQREGPYLLLGNCGGAVVAFEMAQQLRAAGRVVSGLVLVDPVPHPYLSPWMASSVASAMMHRSRAAFRLVRSQIAARSGRTLSGQQRRRLVFKSLQGAIGLYRPRPYEGDTLLIYSEEYAHGLENSRGFAGLIAQLRTAKAGREHGRDFSQYLEPTTDIISNYLEEVTPVAKD